MLLTTTQVAARLGVSPRTVTNWIRAERVPYVRLPGGEYRIPLDGLLDSLGGTHDLRPELGLEVGDEARRRAALSAPMAERLARLHHLSRQVGAIAGKASKR